MCYACDERDRFEDKWDCGDINCPSCFPDSQPEEEKVVTGPFDGMQYRTSGWLGEWKDVEKGQTSFDVTDARQVEFRRKPEIVGTFDNLDGTTAEFYSEDWLINAIKKRIGRGENDFDLKVRFKK